MKLNENIRFYRTSAGMSQADLAKALGLSAQAVSKWENGKAEPDSACIERLCNIFQTTPTKLYGFEENIFDIASKAVDIQNYADRTAPRQDAQESKYLAEQPKVPHVPVTSEARILAAGVDRMPEADRKRLLKMVDLMFEQYAEFFEKGTDAHDP